MAQTIPCDLCNEYAALLLVTFLPKVETIGLGLECITPWAESIAEAISIEGEDAVDPNAIVFRVTAIPTGDEEMLTLGGALQWAEAMVRAIDAQKAAEAAGPEVEPITTPDRPKGRKRAVRGRTAPVDVPADMADDEWEASGLEGRPPLTNAATGTDGGGPVVEEGEPQAASDQG